VRGRRRRRLVVDGFEELPRLGLGSVELVALAARALRVVAGLGGRQDPWREVVFGRRHPFHALFDWVIVFVAGHAYDVEEDLAQGV